MRSTKSFLLAGAFWIMVSRLMVNAIGLVSTIILARLLMPEDFGLVAIASAAAGIFAAISEMSLAEALIQHDDPDEEHFDTAWTMNALRGLLLALIIAVLGWPASIAYDDPRLMPVMFGLAVANFIGGFVNPRLALFERRLEFRQWIVLSGGEKLAGFMASATIAIIFRSYWALVAGVIASQAMRVLASYILITYRPRFRLSRFRDLFSFSVWLTLGQCVQAVNWRADPLLLGVFMPTRAVGYFGMGGRISTLAVSEVLQPISQVLFPAFSRIRNDAGRLRSAYLRAQGLLCLIAMPIGFGLAAIAEPLVGVVLGSRWFGAVQVIQFLAVAAALQRMNQLHEIGMATGNTKALFYRDLRAMIVRLPLMLSGLVLGPMLGLGSLLGALIGHTVSSLVNTMLNMHLVTRISDVTMSEQLAQIWRPLLAAGGMTAGVSAFITFGGSFEGARSAIVLILLFGCIAAAGMAYVLLLIVLWFIAGRPKGPETEAVAIASNGLARLQFSLARDVPRDKTDANSNGVV